MEAGRPDFANDGSYQEITLTAYKALSTAKANYTKVVKSKIFYLQKQVVKALIIFSILKKSLLRMDMNN